MSKTKPLLDKSASGDPWLDQPAGRVTSESQPVDERASWFTLTSTERKAMLFIVDLLLVNGVLLLAVTRWAGFVLSWEYLWIYSKWFVTLSLIWTVVSLAMNIYNPMVAASSTYSALYAGITSIIVGGIYWLVPWLTPPPGRRLLVLGSLLMLGLAVAGWRVLFARFFYQPSFRRRVLLVGEDRMAARIAEDVKAAGDAERANPLRGTGYQIVGLSRTPLPEVGTGLDPALLLVRRIRRLGVQEVLVTDPATLSPTEEEALLDCREVGIQVGTLAATYARLTGRLPVEYAEHDIDLIVNDNDNPLRHLYAAAKRLSDVGLGLVGVLGLAVLMPFVALGNALTAPGPLFYRQTRVGAGGRPFALVKFRTMRPDAEKETSAVWAQKGDPRVTPLGRWMRKLRMDELPQVLNVLKGEMSIIGPRPERPQFVGEISRQLPIYRARHSVKPGITGWAQVHYHYGDSIEDARIKLEYDLFYIKHAGFWVDALILLRTFPTIFMFRGQ